MAKTTKPKDAKQLAVLCSKLAAEKHAEEILLLDIAEIDGSPAEWFVIATCSSEPQVNAIAQHIEVTTKKAGIDIPKSEGWESMNWIIMDYFDVVVHLMRPQARSFYKLEKLWGDANAYNISAAGRLVKYKPSKTTSNPIDDEE